MSSLPSLSSKPVIASSSSSPPRSSSLGSSPATSISFPYNSTANKPPSTAGTQIRSSTTSRSETCSDQYINRETLLPEKSKAAARVTKMEGATVAENWREIHGSNNWEGMLDPMDPVLRSEILRYGEFTQACYDAFDWDIHSKYCGTSRYDSASFFDRIGISDCGYRVNRFLYAASNQKIGKFFRYSKHQKAWSSRANWIGYVAVCDDPKEIQRLGRRDILISWRGTVTNMEWIEDVMDSLQPAKFGKQDVDESIQVESGFLDFYTEKEEEDQQGSEAPPYCKYSAREQILSEVKRLVDLYRDEELSITITGHSLGSALATLSAYDIAEMGLTTRSDGSKIPTTVFSFSGPRVGNTRFKDRCMELGLKVLRVLNLHDVVPKVPGLVVNEKAGEKLGKLAEDLLHYPWSFSHVGVELSLDHKVSPYLKETDDLSNFHNLEGLLHLVDGYHGKGLEFSSSTGRDIALVNKSSDFLKEELEMPPSWRQDENKGLVRGPDGRWFVPPREVEAHPADTHIHLQKALSSVV